MKTFIQKQLKKDDNLLGHGLIIFVGSFIANVLNYLYQLVMGRLLGPADFAVLGALFALIYIVTFSFGAITTVAMKFASDFYAKNEMGKVKGLLKQGLAQLSIIALLGFIVYFFVAPFIAEFLHIEERTLMLWTGLFLAIALITPLPMGILNGLQRYMPLTFISVFVAFLKLALGLLFVVLGFGVFGALLGLNIAAIFGFILAIIILFRILTAKSVSIGKKAIFEYTLPVFLGLTLMNLFVNLDVLLVKHFFSDVAAGNYAAASVMGKMVLFASGALIMVMFPKVSFSKSSGKQSAFLLKSTLFYTALISGAVVLLFFFIPTFLSGVLFGSAFSISGLIGLLGLAICLFSISNVLVFYNLAVHKTGFVYGLIPLLLLEVFGIVFFHHTLLEVVQVVFVTNVLILGYMLFFSRKVFGVNGI